MLICLVNSNLLLTFGSVTIKETMDVYILYECDAWHTRSSMEILGVFSDREAMTKALRSYVEDFVKTGRLDADCVDELVDEFNDLGQTQGYATNFTMEKWELDKYEV